jgi:hypothetical protein
MHKWRLRNTWREHLLTNPNCDYERTD